MTEKDIFDAIKKRYDDPGYIVLPHVRNSTGYPKTTRTADALIFCAWPSRGFELWGIEIKVRRSDWQKELMLPGKADAIAQYCDRWFVACPNGIVKTEELPKGWGLMVMGKDGKKIATRVASKLSESQPMTRAFLAAILRVAVGTVSTEAQLKHEFERGRREGLKEANERERHDSDWALAQAEDSLRALQADVRAFEQQAGFSIKAGWKADAKKMGAIVRHVLATDFDTTVNVMRERIKQVKTVVDRCDLMLGEMPAKTFEPQEEVSSWEE